ncbi:hypothetical protein E2I00_009945, partial [Balaenoptera physalus]
MESDWDVLRVGGSGYRHVPAAVGDLGGGLHSLCLPAAQARRGKPWLRAHRAWAGLNIVLIRRDLSTLEHEAKAIERLLGKSTRVIQVDFTGGLEIYEAIEAGLKDLEIGKFLDVINCNMMSVVQMTRIVLPQMVTSGKGIIINISSITDRSPYPFAAVYADTTAFARSFSVAVGAEYHSEGVIVQALDTLGLTSQTPECLRHAVQVLSWGNPCQRAGCDSPWPGSTNPQKGGDLQRRGGSPPRAGEPGEEMGDSRMGGVLILGTSPSQGFLLTIFLPSWFFLSRWGLKLLSL